MSRIRRRTERCVGAVLLAWAGLAPGAHADDDFYVYQLPFEAGAQALTPAGLTLSVSARDIDGLRKRLTMTTVAVEPGAVDALRVTLAGQDTLAAAPSGAHLAPTFLIDFVEPSVQALVTLAGDVGEGAAAARRLSEFVNARMGPSPYSRAFDAASIVARDRVGDCTEHAVLVTALARAKAFPARTVVGVLVLAGGDVEGAYGHAWTEVWAGGAWRLVDATLPENDYGGQVYYMPVGDLSDEGMGYAMALFELIGTMPTRLGPAATVRD